MNGETVEAAAEELEPVVDFIYRSFYSRVDRAGKKLVWPVDCPVLEQLFYAEQKRRRQLKRTLAPDIGDRWLCLLGQ